MSLVPCLMSRAKRKCIWFKLKKAHGFKQVRSKLGGANLGSFPSPIKNVLHLWPEQDIAPEVLCLSSVGSFCCIIGYLISGLYLKLHHPRKHEEHCSCFLLFLLLSPQNSHSSILTTILIICEIIYFSENRRETIARTGIVSTIIWSTY